MFKATRSACALMSMAMTAAMAMTAVLALVGCGSGGDPRDFTPTLSPSAVPVIADYTTPAVELNIKPDNGYSGLTTIVATLPPGFTCVTEGCAKTLDVALEGISSVPLRFDTEATLVPGEYTIGLHIVGLNGRAHDASIQVQVGAYNGIPPPPDFDFSVDPAVLVLEQREAAHNFIHYTVTVERYNHYTGPVHIDLSPDPNASCSPIRAASTRPGTAKKRPLTWLPAVPRDFSVKSLPQA
jgi:hypothetical protein